MTGSPLKRIRTALRAVLSPSRTARFLPASLLVAAQVLAAPALFSFRSVATEADFNLYFPAYLANGYFSTTTSLRGTDATPAYMIGLMDHTPSDISRPAAIPSWSEIDVSDGASWLNSTPVTAQGFDNYGQTLDRYNGTLDTHYSWQDGSRSTQIAVRTFVSEASAHAGAIALTVTPQFDGRVTLRFTLRPFPAPLYRLPLARMSRPEKDAAIAAVMRKHEVADLTGPDITDGPDARRPVADPRTSPNRAGQWYPGQVAIESYGGDAQQRTLWIRGHSLYGQTFCEAAAVAMPVGLKPDAVKLFRSAQLVQLEVSFTAQRGRSYTFVKFVAATRMGWGDPGATRQMARSARAAGYAALWSAHQAAWHSLWKSNIEVDGDDPLQRVVNADLFALLENSTANTQWAIQGMGLSPIYGGHVAWDCDSWHFPVLLMLDPQRARSIVNYRYRVLPAAEANARRHGYQGAMYAWESDPENGTETTPFFAHAFADREIHMSADVAIAQWQYYLMTGDQTFLRQEGYPVLRAVAAFWKSRCNFDAAHDRYEILHVTSPDEAYDDVNNDSFTNAVAQKALRAAVSAAEVLGVQPDPQWTVIADKMYIPFSESEQRHLDFDPSTPHNRQTWMGSSISWLSYPQLDLKMSEQVRRNDFDFATKALHELTPDANDMVPVMLGIEAAELDDADAVGRWLNFSIKGFLKPPFDVRSETPRNNTLYILCVSGGFLENFLNGFTGLRITDDGLKQVYPAVLPPQVQRLVLHNVSYRGRRFDFIVQRDAQGKATLSRRPAVQ